MLVVTNCAKNDASTIDKSLVENGGRGGKGAVTTLTCTGQITLHLRMTLEMLDPWVPKTSSCYASIKSINAIFQFCVALN